MFLPHFDVFCDLLLNRRTATWNLLILYNKETNYHRKKKKFFHLIIFQHDSKAGLCSALRPLWQTRKKAISRNLLSIQMKQSHWLLCVAKEFWLVQENHATVILDSSVAPRGMKVTAKAKSNCEIYKSWRKCWKNRDSFCHQSSPVSWIAWTLPWIVQELKK